MKKLTLLSTGFILVAINAIAQADVEKVLNTSGGSHTTGHYVFEWSVGEMSIVNSMQSSNNDLVITNGFLQPGTGKQINTGQYFSREEIIILPNPTYNKIQINILTVQQGSLSISIHDAAGKELQKRKVIISGIGSTENFELSSYASGIYFIHLDLSPSMGSIKKTGTFKVVKY